MMLIYIIVSLILVSGVACKSEADVARDLLSFGEFNSMSFVGKWPNDTFAPCSDQWQGITCDADTNDVTKIEFVGQKLLRGRMPPTIDRLSALRRLVLSRNSLDGTLPISLAHLPSLTYLDLSYNMFQGALPEATLAMPQLVFVRLNHNYFEHVLNSYPSSVAKDKLDVNLECCLLEGTSSFLKGSCTECPYGTTRADATNQCVVLDGSLSSDAYYMAKEMPEYVRRAGFDILSDGTDPCTSWPGITCDVVQNKNPDGSLTEGARFVEWRVANFDMQSSLTPVLFAEINRLRLVSLEHTGLTGTLPESLGELKEVQRISLAHNKLVGTIPSTLYRMVYPDSDSGSGSGSGSSAPGAPPSSLQVLDLSNNHLTGELVTNMQFPSMTQLHCNFFRGNHTLLSTRVHRVCSSCPDGYTFQLFTNQCQFDVYTLADDKKALESLGINALMKWVAPNNDDDTNTSDTEFRKDNPDFYVCTKWSGVECVTPVGASAAESRVQKVTVAPPRLKPSEVGSGSLPVEGLFSDFVKLTAVTHFTMKNGVLAGALGDAFVNLFHVRVLDLSHNKLDGPLHADFKYLTRLTTLRLNHNRLTGTVPEGFPAVADLACNFLTGDDPLILVSDDNEDSGIKRFPCGDCPIDSVPVLNSTQCRTDTAHINTDMRALFALPFAGAMGWTTETSMNPCVWTGISCRDHGRDMGERVSALRVPGRGLQGNDLSSLPFLSELEVLDISHNKLTSELPSRFVTMDQLKHVDMSYNALQGSLPSAIDEMTHLDYIDFSHNHFFGAALDGSYIRVMNISCNFLTGDSALTFGKSCSTCPAGMENPNPNRNQCGVFIALTPTPIPDPGSTPTPSTHNQTALKKDLMLLGATPMGPPMEWTARSRNHACASEDDGGWFGVHCSNQANGDIRVTTVNVHKVPIEGGIGKLWPMLDGLTELTSLKITNTELDGALTRSVRKPHWPKLTYLDISYNLLTGPLDLFAEIKSLQRFIAVGNFFTGTVPLDLPTVADISCNNLVKRERLSGTQDDELFQKWRRARELLVLNGPCEKCTNVPKSERIPSKDDADRVDSTTGTSSSSSSSSLASSSTAGTAYVEPNNFPLLGSNQCSQKHTQTSDLTALYLGRTFAKYVNWYKDTWFNACSKHSWKGLTCNGDLSRVSSIVLPSLEIKANFPHEFGQLNALVVLDLSDNRLFGLLPREINFLVNLKRLDLSDNELTGPVWPTGVQFALHKLVYLNLAGNVFVGSVPFDLPPIAVIQCNFLEGPSKLIRTGKACPVCPDTTFRTFVPGSNQCTLEKNPDEIDIETHHTHPQMIYLLGTMAVMAFLSAIMYFGWGRYNRANFERELRAYRRQADEGGLRMGTPTTSGGGRGGVGKGDSDSGVGDNFSRYGGGASDGNRYADYDEDDEVDVEGGDFYDYGEVDERLIPAARRT